MKIRSAAPSDKRPRARSNRKLTAAPHLVSWSDPDGDFAEAQADVCSEVIRNLLVGERDHRLYLLKPEQIDYIQANGNYVRFSAAGTDYIKRDTIKRLSMALAGRGFVRIERSLLINMAAVLYVQRVGRGVFAFTLSSGGCIRSGARYRAHILSALPLARASHHSWRSTRRPIRRGALSGLDG